MDAAAAQDVAAAGAAVPDLFDDIDCFNLDDFDFDLAADEFCDAYAAFINNADKSGAPAGGWLAGSGIDVDDCDGGSSRGSSSPESAVTDGPDAGEEEGALSAYVCELERFLLGNSDDDDVDIGEVAACPGGVGAEEEEPLSVDDYFFGDDLLAGHGSDDAAAGEDADADEEESLAAREDDEPASRKRARHKIKSTTMMPCSWGELEVTRRHLAPPMKVPALWLQAAPALLCV